ncbi:hypothetical protein V1505DRAFT_183179 [Lipomyces doorenjongii]
MKTAVKDALAGLEARHALEAISSKGRGFRWLKCCTVPPLLVRFRFQSLRDPTVTTTNVYHPSVELLYTYVGSGHYGSYKPSMPKQPADKDSVKFDVEFAYVFYRYLSRLLARGDFCGHPFEVIPGGLAGFEEGLNKLKNGEARGVKYVYRIR